VSEPRRSGRSSFRPEGAPRPARGAPPRLRALPALTGSSLGVDLGGTKIRLASVGPKGRFLAEQESLTRPARGAEAVLRDLVAGARACIEQTDRPVRAVGIGIAGQVDRQGVLRAAPNLRWKNIPLRARLEAALGLPVTVTNDVRAITFGEWFFGAGHGVPDMVCVYLGTGVGGGVVADGRLQYGATETAGEVGHMTIVANGRQCHCRNRGCLEAYVGGWAIAERAREAVRRRPAEGGRLVVAAGGHRSAITTAAVAAAARAGDPLAREIVRETSDYLAAGMVGVVNAFNPDLLILGGGVVDGLPSLVRTTETQVRARGLSVAVRSLLVRRADLGDRAGVLGAAAMAGLGVPGGT
jgi:glucokinase